jgi:hypothetical protein
MVKEGIRGQAALEWVLVLPLLLLLSLGLLQWVWLHQAHLLMDYAAFSAGRVGAVWNGSPERMRSAALFALLPLYGRTDSAGALEQARQRESDLDQLLRSQGGAGLIRVVLQQAPHPASRNRAVADDPTGPWQELDFDGVGTFTEGEGPDPSRDRSLREATLLRLRVEALVELKLPVINAAFFWAWRSLRERSDRPSIADDPALLAMAHSRRFFLPLAAEYQMRMQSNVYRKWVDR